jgi:hypothetical protein
MEAAYARREFDHFDFLSYFSLFRLSWFLFDLYGDELSCVV